MFYPMHSINTSGRKKSTLNINFNDLYSSPTIVQVIISRKMIWVGHVRHMGEGRVVYRVLVEKPEGKRPLERPMCR
jgi:hypothetical protein